MQQDDLQYQLSLAGERVLVALDDRHPYYSASMRWVQATPVHSEDDGGEIRHQVALRLFAAAVAHLAPMTAEEASAVLLAKYESAVSSYKPSYVSDADWKAFAREVR